MKRYGCLFLVLMMGLLCFGCFGGASITLKISPNPVVFEYQQYDQEITVEITTSGMGKLTIDQALFILYDDAEVEVAREVIDVSTSVPFVIPGVSKSFTETISLPDEYQYMDESTYDQNLRGREFTLEIIITGSKTTQVSANISFE